MAGLADDARLAAINRAMAALSTEEDIANAGDAAAAEVNKEAVSQYFSVYWKDACERFVLTNNEAVRALHNAAVGDAAKAAVLAAAVCEQRSAWSALGVETKRQQSILGADGVTRNGHQQAAFKAGAYPTSHHTHLSCPSPPSLPRSDA